MEALGVDGHFLKPCAGVCVGHQTSPHRQMVAQFGLTLVVCHHHLGLGFGRQFAYLQKLRQFFP